MLQEVFAEIADAFDRGIDQMLQKTDRVGDDLPDHGRGLAQQRNELASEVRNDVPDFAQPVTESFQQALVLVFELLQRLVAFFARFLVALRQPLRQIFFLVFDVAPQIGEAVGHVFFGGKADAAPFVRERHDKVVNFSVPLIDPILQLLSDALPPDWRRARSAYPSHRRKSLCACGNHALTLPGNGHTQSFNLSALPLIPL